MPSGFYKRSKQQLKRQREIARILGLGNKGENHPMWKGGITPLRKKLYFSMEYKLWRNSVFERDKWTCIFCGLKGGWNKQFKKKIEIHADHIKPWCDYPELRFAIDNGRTLCIDCHKKTPTYGVHK